MPVRVRKMEALRFQMPVVFRTAEPWWKMLGLLKPTLGRLKPTLGLWNLRPVALEVRALVRRGHSASIPSKRTVDGAIKRGCAYPYLRVAIVFFDRSVAVMMRPMPTPVRPLELAFRSLLKVPVMTGARTTVTAAGPSTVLVPWLNAVRWEHVRYALRLVLKSTIPFVVVTARPMATPAPPRQRASMWLLMVPAKRAGPVVMSVIWRGLAAMRSTATDPTVSVRQKVRVWSDRNFAIG